MNRQKLMQELRRDEGVRYEVYDDATGRPVQAGDTLQGHPTIGVGRNLTAARGVDDLEVDTMLDNDIRIVTRELDAAMPWWRNLSDARQRALANMCFNLGLPTLRQFERMLAALQGSNYDEAAREALDSRWARQVGARAERIAEAFREG
jgi:lysozyme